MIWCRGVNENAAAGPGPEAEVIGPDTIRLDGEVAIVTGGAGGIGTAVARTLAAAGARVAVGDLNLEAAHELAGTLGAGHLAVELDVRSTASVLAAVETLRGELGPATILFNGAGVQRVRPTVEVTPEDWDFVVDINLGGTFRCCQAFGRDMVAGGHGAIVNVASLTGIEIGGGGRVPYAASKGGVLGLTRALAVEWAPRGVRVNAIAPGITLTPLIERLADDGSLDLDDYASRIPLGRIGTPNDMAGVTLMLVSRAGEYIIGQTLIVDGGLTSVGPRDTSEN